MRDSLIIFSVVSGLVLGGALLGAGAQAAFEFHTGPFTSDSFVWWTAGSVWATVGAVAAASILSTAAISAVVTWCWVRHHIIRWTVAVRMMHVWGIDVQGCMRALQDSGADLDLDAFTRVMERCYPKFIEMTDPSKVAGHYARTNRTNLQELADDASRAYEGRDAIRQLDHIGEALGLEEGHRSAGRINAVLSTRQRLFARVHAEMVKITKAHEPEMTGHMYVAPYASIVKQMEEAVPDLPKLAKVDIPGTSEHRKAQREAELGFLDTPLMTTLGMGYREDGEYENDVDTVLTMQIGLNDLAQIVEGTGVAYVLRDEWALGNAMLKALDKKDADGQTALYTFLSLTAMAGLHDDPESFCDMDEEDA